MFKKDKVLVVGNSGRFLKYLNNFACSNKIHIEIINSENLYEFDLSEYLVGTPLDEVIFVGGETRDVNKMLRENFIKPKYLLDFCIQHKICFTYLSSLSVFGCNNIDSINLNSIKIPINVYGSTKLLFDKYLKDSNYHNYKAIYPASIHAFNGRSSIEKFSKYFRYLGPLSCLFLFSGNLTYISRRYVINSLFTDFRGGLILSKNFSIKKTYSPKIRIPNVLLILISFFSKKLSYNLRMLYNGISYK